ncbi:hypothetical protein D3C86_1879520 [compost metagenome]
MPSKVVILTFGIQSISSQETFVSPVTSKSKNVIVGSVSELIGLMSNWSISIPPTKFSSGNN